MILIYKLTPPLISLGGFSLFSHYPKWNSFDWTNPSFKSQEVENWIADISFYFPTDCQGCIEKRVQSIGPSDILYSETMPSVAIVCTCRFDKV